MSTLKTQHKRLGDILVEASLITEEQLQQALIQQKAMGLRLGKVLVETGITDENSVAQTLARQMDIPFLNLNEINIANEVLTTIPEGIVRTHNILPIKLDGNQLQISMVDPLDVFIIDEISYQTGYEVNIAISAESQIEAAIKHYYGKGDNLQIAADNIVADRIDDPSIEENYFTTYDVKNEEEIPIISLVNSIIDQAISDKASDIHIEPSEDMIRVRYRIDGILYEPMRAPKAIQNELLSRLKIMAQMDISEKRLPQDGRIKVKHKENQIDLRISSLPTVFGEKIVIRILDKSTNKLTLDQVGFDETLLELFKTLSISPNGIILMTGPTGSGKTSTLYAAINHIKNEEINITTVEDPVEYLIPSINQVQVRPDIGLSFARTLRSILRQDPNVILIGEIRDFETAQIAIESALTGHLVFSTLHTNDAASAVTRLIEMGLEPYLVASALVGVAAQRLLRQICPYCKTPYEAFGQALELLEQNNIQNHTLFKGKGCLNCRRTGYLGRTAIHEIMTIDDDIHALILRSTSARTIRKTAIQNGMRTMRLDGILKALRGITSIEEVVRMTRNEEVTEAIFEKTAGESDE